MPQTTPFAIRSQNYVRFNAHENDERHARVTGDDTLTETEKMNHTELSLDLTLIFPGPVDATPTNNIVVRSNPANMFKTPTNLAPLVAKTQASSVQIMSEAAVFDRIIQEEETLNINARALDFDIDDTSEIIQISNGPIVRNRWFLGNLSKEREPGIVNCLFKWLDEAESPTLNRIYIMHPKPRHIEITGIDLRGSFLNGQDYTYDLMDMSVRRSNQMDLQMRGAETKITWRHTMESDFAMFVLGNEDPFVGIIP